MPRPGAPGPLFSTSHHPSPSPSIFFPPFAEDPAAAAPAVPLSDKAEWWLNFKAKSASLDSGVVTFNEPSEKIRTTVGDVNLAEAFAPGKISPDIQADGVVTGKTAEGKDVLTVIRFSAPEYKDGKLTAKAAPVIKTDTPTLRDGEVQKALNNDKFVPMSPELKTASLDDVEITLDSRAAPGAREDGKGEIPTTTPVAAEGTAAPTEPASAAAGRKLLYGGNVAAGAIIGSAACGGSIACGEKGGGERERKRAGGEKTEKTGDRPGSRSPWKRSLSHLSSPSSLFSGRWRGHRLPQPGKFGGRVAHARAR